MLLQFNFKLLTMEFLMNFPQLWVGDVRIDLGSGNVFMPEHLLNGAKIGAI